MRGLVTAGTRRWLAAVLAAGACMTAGAQQVPAAASAPADAATRVLDDFDNIAAWQAVASDEVRAQAVAGEPGEVCLRYDFGRVSGYAVLRRQLPIDFPPHFALDLRLRGSGPANIFQFKMVDASGDNVWWFNRPNYLASPAAADLTIRPRQIEFAWGPAADRRLTRTASVEFVVASGKGGRGELCFDRLALRSLPVPGPLPPPQARASSGTAALAATDGDAKTAWRSAAGAEQQWQVDYGSLRELNGLLLRWADGARASDFDVQFSDDGQRWRTVRRVRGSTRDLLPLWLPDSETRHVRLQLQRGTGARYALAELTLKSPEDWRRRDDMLASIAAETPRGRFPRAYVGEQNYWTLVATDGGGAVSALLSEDGAIEPHRAGPSLEPFVIDERGTLTSWADAQIDQRLRDGYLPLPSVRWTGPDHRLAVEVAADGSRTRAQLLARYTLTNTGEKRRSFTLALAARPWQVNPPQQFLNTPGGVSPIERVAWQAPMLRLDDRDWLRTVTPPDSVDAASFEQGDVLDLVRRAGASERSTTPLMVEDGLGLASAVLRWRITLEPGASRTVAVVLPLAGAPAVPEAADAAWAGQRMDAVAAAWRERLNRVRLELPAQGQPLADTLRSALAQILMSRDGPALQPGTRSYARSWVRDGAMMVAGLLRLGEVDASRAFVQWYADHLFANGKVPCCVDARGADPVAENDSHGQFIYAVAELWRHTRDRALLEPLWPKVDAAARYMESLRQSERTPANREPGRQAFYGMMPASISHEGYSAKPMHSYWDNFWALAGWRDAVELADAMGETARSEELGRQYAEFRDDLSRSLAAAVAQHRIDYLPGAAELGDYDPSSSTMIFSPAGAEGLVPRRLLESTWERWWRESVARRDGQRAWDDYTPYELRSVSALVRLGQPERAHAMLDFFLRDRRPDGWNQWAEVVRRLPREPRFLGDMPHAWISSDYIRSMLDLLAYERDGDAALVVGAGVPAAWWRSAPVQVAGLRTAHGLLGYRLERADPRTLVLTIARGDLEDPPGGLWFAWSEPGTPPPATLADGRRLAWEGRQLRLPEGVTQVRLALP